MLGLKHIISIICLRLQHFDVLRCLTEVLFARHRDSASFNTNKALCEDIRRPTGGIKWLRCIKRVHVRCVGTSIVEPVIRSFNATKAYNQSSVYRRLDYSQCTLKRGHLDFFSIDDCPKVAAMSLLRHVLEPA